MNVEVTYKKEEIIKLLESSIKNGNFKHSKLLSEIIVEELANTSNGLKNLMLAINGICLEIEDYNFKIGEKVSIPVDELSGWSIDKDAMAEQGMILNNTVEAEISGFDRTRNNCIGVKYIAISSSSGNRVETPDYIYPRYIKKTIL